VVRLREERNSSERNACRLVEQWRSTQRCQARVDQEKRRIRRRLDELARMHPGSGYRRMTQLLRREGWRVHKKRVQRLWEKEGLRNPPRKRRKRARGRTANRCAVKKAEYKNHVWCGDFTMEETMDGRRLKWFSVVDEYTRECLAMEVERGMTARDVVGILTGLESWHGAPPAIRCYNGPEFIARAVQTRLQARKVGPLYIAPGSPWENGVSESFNCRMKGEFVDRELFASPAEAQVLPAEYRRYWNTERLHSGIGDRTPAEFAASLASGSAPPERTQKKLRLPIQRNLQPALAASRRKAPHRAPPRSCSSARLQYSYPGRVRQPRAYDSREGGGFFLHDTESLLAFSRKSLALRSLDGTCLPW
jgi:putative transposase